MSAYLELSKVSSQTFSPSATKNIYLMNHNKINIHVKKNFITLLHLSIAHLMLVLIVME